MQTHAPELGPRLMYSPRQNTSMASILLILEEKNASDSSSSIAGGFPKPNGKEEEGIGQQEMEICIRFTPSLEEVSFSTLN